MILIIKNKKQRNISLILSPSHRNQNVTILAKNIQFEYIYIKIYEKKEIIRAAKEQG